MSFSVKILDYYNTTVHSLVCNKLNILSYLKWGTEIIPYGGWVKPSNTHSLKLV
jgi:hypothetical protein